MGPTALPRIVYHSVAVDDELSSSDAPNLTTMVDKSDAARAKSKAVLINYIRHPQIHQHTNTSKSTLPLHISRAMHPSTWTAFLAIASQAYALPLDDPMVSGSLARVEAFPRDLASPEHGALEKRQWFYPSDICVSVHYNNLAT